jgi:hypothetical protein
LLKKQFPTLEKLRFNCAMPEPRQKITLAEMRAAGVRGLGAKAR